MDNNNPQYADAVSTVCANCTMQDKKTICPECPVTKSVADNTRPARPDIVDIVVKLDMDIWQHFYPESNTDSPEKKMAWSYLKADIESILSDRNKNMAEAEQYILDTIARTGYEDEIMQKIHIDKCKTAAIMRRDFATALKNCKKGTDLSSILEWSFSPADIQDLAELHKKNRYSRKIEDLLEDCNFHYECGKFMNHEYDEFLKT